MAPWRCCSRHRPSALVPVDATIASLALNGWRLDMANDETFGGWFEAVIEGRMSDEALAEAMLPFLSAIA